MSFPALWRYTIKLPWKKGSVVCSEDFRWGWDSRFAVNKKRCATLGDEAIDRAVMSCQLKSLGDELRRECEKKSDYTPFWDRISRPNPDRKI